MFQINTDNKYMLKTGLDNFLKINNEFTLKYRTQIKKGGNVARKLQHILHNTLTQNTKMHLHENKNKSS